MSTAQQQTYFIFSVVLSSATSWIIHTHLHCTGFVYIVCYVKQKRRIWNVYSTRGAHAHTVKLPLGVGLIIIFTFQNRTTVTWLQLVKKGPARITTFVIIAHSSVRFKTWVKRYIITGQACFSRMLFADTLAETAPLLSLVLYINSLLTADGNINTAETWMSWNVWHPCRACEAVDRWNWKKGFFGIKNKLFAAGSRKNPSSSFENGFFLTWHDIVHEGFLSKCMSGNK